MKKADVMNSMKEQKPEFEEEAFRSVIPEFSFSVNGTQVVIRVKAIVGAEDYEAKLWRPVLKEITFVNQPVKVGAAGNPFVNANVVVTGTINGMNRKDITELLTLLGANVNDSVTKNTTYLIVGEAPGAKKLSTALNYGTKIITEGHFAKLLSESAVDEDA